MYEIDKKEFGIFVAELRKERGYTQKELAEKLFISDKAVSKWETGVSIPDTALFIPLSELLDVTVTELLLCQRTGQEESFSTGQVESVVKIALTYAEEKPARAYQSKSRWPLIYIISFVTGIAGTLLSLWLQFPSESLLTSTILGAVFGAYFCFFVKTKLPPFYDQNRCSVYYDGPVRMNLPGVVFTNSNWPHIVRVGRIWACSTISLFPAIHLCMSLLAPEIWLYVQFFVILTISLGGLFIPIYIVAKKYE